MDLIITCLVNNQITIIIGNSRRVIIIIVIVIVIVIIITIIVIELSVDVIETINGFLLTA